MSRARDREKIRQLVNEARYFPLLDVSTRKLVNLLADALDQLTYVCESMEQELGQKADRSDRD